MVGGFEEVEEDKGFIMGFGEVEFHPCKALAVMLQVYRRRIGSRVLIHFYYLIAIIFLITNLTIPQSRQFS